MRITKHFLPRQKKLLQKAVINKLRLISHFKHPKTTGKVVKSVNWIPRIQITTRNVFGLPVRKTDFAEQSSL